MAYSLGIDSSTQSMSAIVIDLDNQVVCEHAINFGKTFSNMTHQMVF